MDMHHPTQALYAGTFDPFTNGHHDIVRRALEIFDEVRVVIAVPYTKKPYLPKDVRCDMLNELFRDEPRVKVDTWPELTIEYARRHNIKFIIRGLRPIGDFDFEFQMASMNRQINSEVDTVFLMTGPDNFYISSSLVKEVFDYGGDISKFVPPSILKRLIEFKGASHVK